MTRRKYITNRESDTCDLSAPVMGASPVYVVASNQIMHKIILDDLDYVHTSGESGIPWYEHTDRLIGALNLTEPT